jgi:hypothetical protein
MPILGTIASSRQVAAPETITWLYTTTISGSSTNSVNLTGIGGYDDLMILMSARTSTSPNPNNADNQMTVNNNTGNNYRAKLLFASGSPQGESAAGTNIYRAGYSPYGDMTANFYGNTMFYFYDYAQTNTYKHIRWQGISPINTSASFMIMAETTCFYAETAAITSVQISNGGFGSTYADGTQFFVYGIKR